MQEIEIELIPANALRHTQERCRVIIRQPDEREFHTIAGANGEETLAHWLEAGQQPVAFNILERIGGPG